MDRHSEALQLAEELLADVELSRLGIQRLVLKASRLARLVQDGFAQEWLGYELQGYHAGDRPDEVLVWVRRSRDPVGEHKLRLSIGEIESTSAVLGLDIGAMAGTTFAGESAQVAGREHQQLRGDIVLLLTHLRATESDVRARVHDFVSRTFEGLLFSDLQSDLFRAAQAEIDSRLMPTVGTALDKIEAISERLRAGDPESVSHAMSTCRRLINAAADVLYPPSDEIYMLGEQPLKVGDQQVLNRLQAFVADRTDSKGRRDRLRRVFDGLWSRASSGDHADVDATEARYVFLHTYVALGELLALKDSSVGEE